MSVIAVSVKHMVSNPTSKGKVEVRETKHIPKATLQKKLGPDNFRRFMDGESFKVGNYTMEVS